MSVHAPQSLRNLLRDARLCVLPSKAQTAHTVPGAAPGPWQWAPVRSGQQPMPMEDGRNSCWELPCWELLGEQIGAATLRHVLSHAALFRSLPNGSLVQACSPLCREPQTSH